MMRRVSVAAMLGLSLLASVICGLCGWAPTALVALAAVGAVRSRLRLRLSVGIELLLWIPCLLAMLLPPARVSAGHGAYSIRAVSFACYLQFLLCVLLFSRTSHREEKLLTICVALFTVVGRRAFTIRYAVVTTIFGLAGAAYLYARRSSVLGRLERPGPPIVLHFVSAVVLSAGMACLLPSFERYTVDLISMSSVMRFSGFLGSTDLNGIGKMKLSDRLVLRLESYDPPGYLRGCVYDLYEKGRWRRCNILCTAKACDAPLSFRGAVIAKEAVASARTPVSSGKIAYRGATVFGILFAPPGTCRISGCKSSPRWFASMVARGGDCTEWTYTTGPNPFTAPGFIKDEYLKVHGDLAAALKKLAGNIFGEAGDKREKLGRLAAFFSRGFRYSLETRPSPEGMDPLVNFLLNTRSGHCEFFASAAVVLSRMAGIESRYVTGFTVRERNPLTGAYLVRDRHAHAWAEVRLPGRGWVVLDLTPASAAAGENASFLSWFEYAWLAVKERGLNGVSIWALIDSLGGSASNVLNTLKPFLILLPPVLAAIVILRRRRKDARNLDKGGIRFVRDDLERAVRLLGMLEDALAENLKGGASAGRLRSETPLEYLRRLKPQGERKRIAYEVVKRFNAVRYGGRELPEDVLERLRRQLEVQFNR